MNYFSLSQDDTCFSVSTDMTNLGNGELLKNNPPKYTVNFVNDKYFGGRAILSFFTFKDSITFAISDVQDILIKENSEKSIKVQFGLKSEYGVDQYMLEMFIHSSNNFLTVWVDTISHTLIV